MMLHLWRNAWYPAGPALHATVQRLLWPFKNVMSRKGGLVLLHGLVEDEHSSMLFVVVDSVVLRWPGCYL
jgi:hypothetical protein